MPTQVISQSSGGGRLNSKSGDGTLDVNGERPGPKGKGGLRGKMRGVHAPESVSLRRGCEGRGAPKLYIAGGMRRTTSESPRTPRVLLSSSKRGQENQRWERDP